MADKPRVKAPKQRATPKPDDSGRSGRLLLYGLVAIAAGVAILVLAALTLSGGEPGAEEARAALTDAGCTLQRVDALPGTHSIAQPGGTSKQWNTDPPTS